jgi:hypothetical protein
VNTYPKHLQFIDVPDSDNSPGGLHLAFRYGDEGDAEPICPVISGMTLRGLIEKVEDWEDR